MRLTVTLSTLNNYFDYQNSKKKLTKTHLWHIDLNKVILITSLWTN